MKRIRLIVDLTRPLARLEESIIMNMADVHPDELPVLLLIGYFDTLDRVKASSEAMVLLRDTHWMVRQELGEFVLRYLEDYPILRFNKIGRLLGTCDVFNVVQKSNDVFEVYCE